MALLGFELFMRLLWGCALGLVFVRRTESSEKFVKIASNIAWGLAACAAALLFFSEAADPSAWAMLGLFIVGFQLYCGFLFPWSRLLGIVLVLVAPLAFHLKHGSWEGVLQLLNFVCSSALLGGFFAGQFLGHWFLNVPGMHIKELKKVVNYLYFGLAAKSLEILVFLLWRTSFYEIAPTIDAMGRPLGTSLEGDDFMLKLNPSQSLFSLEGDMLLGLGSYGLILVSMRLLWGILAPWVLALMVGQTLKTRSTQSATGILYAACVMVLIGEATALYLRNVLNFFM